MRQAVYQYLYNYEPFVLFGPAHIWGLIISLALAIGLPIYAKKKLNGRQQQLVGTVLGFLVMANYLAWVVLELIAGTFDITKHLPFHLCRFANLITPLVLWKRSYRVFEILYFWGLSGVLQSAFTPDIVQGFPHFHFFRFFIGHNGLVIAIVYAAVVYNMHPTIKSLWRAFAALNMFLVVALVVNLILGTNYFWILGKPPVPSLLDYMGPWPWYILVAELVALVHFALAYLPIAIIRKRRLNREIAETDVLLPETDSV
ncbi:MAG: TIGR02206 family membrane protein [Fidelibacterota bacterium]